MNETLSLKGNVRSKETGVVHRIKLQVFLEAHVERFLCFAASSHYSKAVMIRLTSVLDYSLCFSTHQCAAFDE